MAQQTQMSNLAKRVGGKLAAAAAKHRDKPVDTGIMRLPPGIKGGIAKLQVAGWFTQEKDGGMVPKGMDYARLAAVVLSPHEHAGVRCAGLHTSQFIPLCDTPAKGKREAKSFDDHFADFVNLLKLLSNGTMVCQETPETDPTGEKTQAFYFACMKQLTDPTQPPVYVNFSTRGWTPPKTPAQPNPEEMVFETWHGLADAAQLNGQAFDPGAGVSVTNPPAGNVAQPPIHEAPPTQMAYASPDGLVDAPPGEEDVWALLDAIQSDPDGVGQEGTDASAAAIKLEELAWKNGWSGDQTMAASWEEIAEMASAPPAVEVGSKWSFTRRDKDGAKMKNVRTGEELPAQEVEVVTVDTEAGTCTLRFTKDGKDVADPRTKKPIPIKLEWLDAPS